MGRLGCLVLGNFRQTHGKTLADPTILLSFGSSQCSDPAVSAGGPMAVLIRSWGANVRVPHQALPALTCLSNLHETKGVP